VSSIQRRMWESRIKNLPEGMSTSSSGEKGTSSYTDGIAGMANDNNPITPGMGSDGGKESGGKDGKGPVLTQRWDGEKGEFKKEIQVSWDVKVIGDDISASIGALDNIKGNLGGFEKNQDVTKVIVKKTGMDMMNLLSKVGAKEAVRIMGPLFGKGKIPRLPAGAPLTDGGWVYDPDAPPGAKPGPSWPYPGVDPERIEPDPKPWYLPPGVVNKPHKGRGNPNQEPPTGKPYEGLRWWVPDSNGDYGWTDDPDHPGIVSPGQTDPRYAPKVDPYVHPFSGDEPEAQGAGEPMDMPTAPYRGPMEPFTPIPIDPAPNWPFPGPDVKEPGWGFSPVWRNGKIVGWVYNLPDHGGFIPVNPVLPHEPGYDKDIPLIHPPHPSDIPELAPYWWGVMEDLDDVLKFNRHHAMD
jgi:hypothetical protein